MLAISRNATGRILVNGAAVQVLGVRRPWPTPGGSSSPAGGDDTLTGG